MDVPDRVGQALLAVLPFVGLQKLLVFVDVPRNDVKVETLGGLRLAIHEQRERLRRRVAQPFVDGQPVALGLGDLLAALVEKQLVNEALRRGAGERAANLARKLDRIDQILAGHLVVDAERDPAHRPVGLPLQFCPPAGHESRRTFFRVRILIGDRSGPRIVGQDRHLQHNAAVRRDRQKRRIRLRAFLTQRGQHDVHDRVEAFEHPQERGVEPARRVAVGRG